jgi:carbon monoxide dehydrogenase subunit G
MKFTSRQDIEAPVAYVFAALRDFESWERAALRRGADVARTDKLVDVRPGVSWMVKFAYRGRERRVALRLTGLEQPTGMEFSGAGTSLDGQAGIDLIALATRRTRLSVTLDLKPRSIGARVMLQSLRLAKSRLNRRFSERVTQLCTEIEARYHQSMRG